MENLTTRSQKFAVGFRRLVRDIQANPSFRRLTGLPHDSCVPHAALVGKAHFN